MKINNETIIFFIYVLVFAYALASYNGLVPYASLAIPVALTLFVIFVIHLLNRLIRNKIE